MTTPSVSMTVERFLACAREGRYNLIPLYKDVSADLETPVSAFLKLEEGQHSFLLESVEGGERQARYSFIGTRPFKVLKHDNTDPLRPLEKELSVYKPMPVAGLPPFTGGAVGYVSYDCVRHFEPKVDIPDKDPLDIPESIFMLCSSVVAFDHVKHTIKVVAHVRLNELQGPADEATLRRMYAQALSTIDAQVARLSLPIPQHAPAGRPASSSGAGSRAEHKAPVMSSNVGQPGYEEFVRTLKEHIRQGDIIQAVPSQRVECKLEHTQAFDLYRELRVVNPSPYMFYLNLGGFQVVGASPEQLVKVINGRVTTHPIAGTRKRGQTEEEDAALEAELLASDKERAEHVMLVDLGRNDVGRIATPGSVKVDSLMHVEKYSHVMHIVSHVSGQLAEGKTVYDAFRAVFPAGTVSGAPKIRAMQLVAGLEKQRRGVYAGAVGYVDFAGTLDTCISIRTLVVKDNIAYLQAGGGIVHDSEPTEEYEESMNKMKALVKAINRAESTAATRSQEEAKVLMQPDTCMKNYGGPVTSLPSTFGKFGGRYVPETLVGALEDLEAAYIEALNDPSFREELKTLQKHYVGRPTPMYFAKRMTDACGGARIWLKREDLAHTGAHKINNGLGQGLLAKRMGKKRIIAETGAGQHGVATATACALLGLDCTVYMGEEDVQRQSLNVFRMKMLGARVVPVTSGSRTLKDAVNEAMRDWVANVRDTFMLIGSAIGPHPFPTIVRDFQCCLGEEVAVQMRDMAGKLPDVAIACIGGGSNAIGLFHPLTEFKEIELIGVEAAGHGMDTDKHSATLSGGSIGVLHGTRTYLLQDQNGQIQPTHSISAGLDYPGVGPEHAHLKDIGRVKYVGVTDDQALEGLEAMTLLEGIIPALEPSHAIYYAMQKARTMSPDQDLLINLCGRGDKDMMQVAAAKGVELLGGTAQDVVPRYIRPEDR